MVAFLVMQGKIFAYIVTVFIGLECATAYDQPNFDAPLFDRDGVSLSPESRDALVESLNAIAADPEADDDLKERSLGIALQLSPLNSNARSANRALIKESSPKVPENAPGPRQIADSLWEMALELLKDRPSPEDSKLAPLLMEVSLIVDPGPESERVWRFGEMSNHKPLRWEPFLVLQKESNLSNQKIPDLLAALKRSQKKRNDSVTAPPPVQPVNPPVQPMKDPEPPVAVPVSEIKHESGQIATVLSTKDGPLPVFVEFKTREPSTDEASLFSVFAPDGSAKGEFEMRVLPAQGLPVELNGIERAVEALKSEYPRWPDNLIGEVSISSPAGASFPPSLSGPVKVLLPVSLLLHQSFSGEILSKDFVILNEGGKKELNGLEDAGGVIKAASSFGANAVGLISIESYPSLLEEAIVKDDIADFVGIPLIGVEGMKGLLETVYGKSALPISEAAQEFKDFLSAKPSTLGMSEYARNDAAVEYLESLVAKYPFHLSAKLMLDFGSKEPSPELLKKRSIAKIDAVLKPFAQHYSAAIDPDRGGNVVDLSGQFRDASSELRTLRESTPEDAVPYLRYAEDVLKAMDVFLAIKNKTTSIGEQRHNELKAAIKVFNEERNRLGVE